MLNAFWAIMCKYEKNVCHFKVAVFGWTDKCGQQCRHTSDYSEKDDLIKVYNV